MVLYTLACRYRTVGCQIRECVEFRLIVQTAIVRATAEPLGVKSNHLIGIGLEAGKDKFGDRIPQNAARQFLTQGLRTGASSLNRPCPLAPLQEHRQPQTK
jgi:hypothetical protein